MKTLESDAELLAFGLALAGLLFVLERVTRPLLPHVFHAFDWTFPNRFRKIMDRVLDQERPLLRRTGWKRALAQLAFYGFIVLGFWGTARAWGAYRFRHDWYLIEPPFQVESGSTPLSAPGRAASRADLRAKLRNMKPNFDAPTQCWEIQNTYPSREACQDVLKEIRTEASTKMKTRGDPLDFVLWMLAQRCIAVADPKAPPLSRDLDNIALCLSPSEW